MSLLLLIIIYLIFISLGLPDSLISSSWPAISQSLSLDPKRQGLISFLIALFTIISSFSTAKFIKIFTTKGVILISIILTIIGLTIVTFSPNFYVLLIATLPLGFGAGAIDAALNSYVATHYKAIHLNWLNAFWGIGAATSPFICGIFLTDLNGWRNAAFCLALVQSAIWFICLISINVWKKAEIELETRLPSLKEDGEDKNIKSPSLFSVLKIRGVIFALVAFFCYGVLETTVLSRYTSMLVFDVNITEVDAANWMALFYIGLVVGRIISGFVSLKVHDNSLIRCGSFLALCALILMCFYNLRILMPISILLLGLGISPLYPSLIHSTPYRFDRFNSQKIMSLQIGLFYLGNISLSPLFGIVAQETSFLILPYFLIGMLILFTFLNEVVNRITFKYQAKRQ